MATIKDIAKMTGCSLMTVSRVFNTPEKVKKETREKVLAATKKLGYVPNAAASALAKGRSRNICIYIPPTLNITDLDIAQTISVIGDKLGAAGYSFTIRRELSNTDNYDGIMAFGLTVEDENKIIEISNKKFVILCGKSDRFGSFVDRDNFDYSGPFKITELILKKGHKQVAFIGVENSSNIYKQRKQGFLDALKKYGEQPCQMIFKTTDNEQSGSDGCEEILAAAQPTAIVCATDQLTIGCVRALQKRGLLIKQIEVTGFGGLSHKGPVSSVQNIWIAL